MKYQKKMVLSQSINKIFRLQPLICKKSVMVCQRSSIDMYKISNGLPTVLMKDLFPINRNPYILRQNSQFSRPRINPLYHGTESILNLGSKIWDLLPNNLKKYVTQMNFKKPINDGNLRIFFADCQSFCTKCLFSGKKQLERSSHLNY